MQTIETEYCLKHLIGIGLKSVASSYAEKDRKAYRDFCMLPLDFVLDFFPYLDASTKAAIFDNNAELIIELVKNRKNSEVLKWLKI